MSLGHKSEPSWRLPLRPFEDELLSSWIVRAARKCADSPHTFASHVWGQLPVWTRDVDRCLLPKALGTLADHLGVTRDQATSTSLREFAERLGCSNPMSAGYIPGLLPVGIYHRLRRRFGQQYCPVCLSTDMTPYMRREWRLAFVYGCQQHRCLLRDACPTCDAPLAIHRSPGLALERCSNCGGHLAIEALSTVAIDWGVQKDLLDAWRSAYCGSLDFSGWLAGVRLVYRGLARPEGQRLLELSCAARATAPTVRKGNWSSVLELSRIEQRAQLLPFAVRLLDQWPEQFISICRAADARSGLFVDLTRCSAPEWMLKVLRETIPCQRRIGRGIRQATKRRKKRYVSMKKLRQGLSLSDLIRKRCSALPELAGEPGCDALKGNIPRRPYATPIS
jgi:hypothetical protein